jgi:hypothetical protein
MASEAIERCEGTCNWLCVYLLALKNEMELIGAHVWIIYATCMQNESLWVVCCEVLEIPACLTLQLRRNSYDANFMLAGGWWCNDWWIEVSPLRTTIMLMIASTMSQDKSTLTSCGSSVIEVNLRKRQKYLKTKIQRNLSSHSSPSQS